MYLLYINNKKIIKFYYYLVNKLKLIDIYESSIYFIYQKIDFTKFLYKINIFIYSF